MQASEIRKRAIKIRKVRRLHRFAGIYFFVLLIIVAATGLLLAWKKDAPGVLSIPTQQGISASPENWLTVEILYDIASDFVRDHFNEIKYPQFERIELRPEKGVIKFILEEKYFEVQLDASTGKVLSTGIRTSDIRTDEFHNLKGAPEEIEANPMLGMHGIRFGLKNPGILTAELKALKKVANQGKTMGILMPQVISVDELKQTKKIIKEIGFEGIKVGIMIETPAAVQLIRDLCNEGINFISFGTNDLTQYILAIDRGNEEVQHLYNELHPAILHQIGYVIRVCKRNNVETSICGQAGSKKEMVKFLVENGIDSITVNADMAKEISDYVAILEQEKLSGTDQEMRQYEVNKEKERIEKDIQRIEEEKEEYLEEHPEDIEELPEKEEEENIEEKINELEDLEEDMKEENGEKEKEL